MITQIATVMAANKATITNGCVEILDFKLLLFLFLALLSSIIGLIMRLAVAFRFYFVCMFLKFHIYTNDLLAIIKTNNNWPRYLIAGNLLANYFLTSSTEIFARTVNITRKLQRHIILSN